MVGENSNHQIRAGDAVDLFPRRLWDRFHVHAFAFPYLSITRNPSWQRYTESDNMPVKGIRSHVGRLFNS